MLLKPKRKHKLESVVVIMTQISEKLRRIYETVVLLEEEEKWGT